MVGKGFMESEKAIHFYFIAGKAVSILKLLKW